MLAPTHSAFGVFLTLIILAVFGIQWGLHWTIILCAILGSILPDIDHPKSVIGRIFKFISVPLERRYEHRTITHSLIGWAIASAIFALIILFGILVIWISGFVWDLEIGIWDFIFL
jgi:inner membrane protein